jgi:type II secretory pathway component PulL
MMAPHQAHMTAADQMHAERLATAARHRLVAGQLRPQAGTPRVQIQRRRVAAAMTSLLLAVIVATGVSAAVNTDQSAQSAPNAAGAGHGAGGGAILVR